MAMDTQQYMDSACEDDLNIAMRLMAELEMVHATCRIPPDSSHCVIGIVIVMAPGGNTLER